MASIGHTTFCVLLVVVGICVVTTASADKEGEVGKIKVKALGKSGKILLSRKGKSNDSITIEMDSMQEYDASGNVVGATGRKKHSFNSFANQEFTFSALKDTTYNNLTCKSFDFNAYLKGPNATLKVTVYLFKESGEMDIGKNESDGVKEGSLKWSIEINNWDFCGTNGSGCKKGGKEEVGDHLDFQIVVKSKGKPKEGSRPTGPPPPKGKKARKRPRRFDMGDNAAMSLSEEVEVDGQWTQMASGFPKFMVKGSKNIFTFRFPKFSSRVFYDPTLEMGEGSDFSGSTAISPFRSCLFASIMALAAVLKWLGTGN